MEETTARDTEGADPNERTTQLQNSMDDEKRSLIVRPPAVGEKGSCEHKHTMDTNGAEQIQGSTQLHNSMDTDSLPHRSLEKTSDESDETVPVDKALVQACHAFVRSEFGNITDEPKVGMVFGSPDEAFHFNKMYSRKIGFGITRRTSHAFYGIKYDVTFSCNKNRKPNTVSNDEGFGEHTREINELAGLAQKKSITAVFTQAGGVTNCTFTERDMRNYIGEVRRLQLKDGDAAALMTYFRNQQHKSPYFYYSYDVDDDGRLKNIFWADARSRMAFKYFGDVITFDTTYLTNRYRIPFAAFVGVNHHGQSILLGCALLSNEMTESFEWCFMTFRSCMHGRAPEAIITGQCSAICRAIESVLKESRHRLCLWHILKKLSEKLAGVPNKDQVIQKICAAVYDSIELAQFDSMWQEVYENNDLGKNRNWFTELYQIK